MGTQAIWTKQGSDLNDYKWQSTKMNIESNNLTFQVTSFINIFHALYLLF